MSTLDEIVSIPNSDITISNILSESVPLNESSPRSLDVTDVTVNSLLMESTPVFKIQKPSCQVIFIIY